MHIHSTVPIQRQPSNTPFQSSVAPVDPKNNKTQINPDSLSNNPASTSASTEKEKQTQAATQQAKQLARQAAQQQQVDLKKIQELASRDREVRAHEQAHASVGGQYAGAPSYEYNKGPDGKNYAVAGEVQISTSEIPGDPAATIKKMQIVRRAALAPAEPSSQDRAVASAAANAENKARAELASQKAEARSKQTEENQEKIAEQPAATSINTQTVENSKNTDPKSKNFSQTEKIAEKYSQTEDFLATNRSSMLIKA